MTMHRCLLTLLVCCTFVTGFISHKRWMLTQRNYSLSSSFTIKSPTLPRSIILRSVNSNGDPTITMRSYQHQNYTLSYLYKPPSLGNESIPPIVFIHPVGIGLSNWFWSKVMTEYGKQSNGNPALYAVDLIGCGLENGSDPWDPQEEGLFFPLSWAQGIETLINDVVMPEYKSNRSNGKGRTWDFFSPVGGNVNQVNGCTVVVQGGLASVGIVLSARNQLSTISKLILTSPPAYNELITPLPQNEIERNYKFLSSPFWGRLAFLLLESRWAIRFFSDLFLFSSKCDEEWLDFAMVGASFSKARTPVEAFNAGLLQSRSFEHEIKSLDQQVMILCGLDDKRNSKRGMYNTMMKNCQTKCIDGLNVVPWENVRGTILSIDEFHRR